MASKTKTGKKPVGRDRVVFDVLSVVILTVLSLFCLLPFWLVLSGSFSDQTSILTHGYQLIPETFSLDAYKTLFKIPGDLLRAYGVTIFVTVTGTFLGLLFTSMAAYVLARENEIRMVRMILSGKRNSLPEDSIRERVREMYV